jgi:hypothetical protein
MIMVIHTMYYETHGGWRVNQKHDMQKHIDAKSNDRVNLFFFNFALLFVIKHYVFGDLKQITSTFACCCYNEKKS